jgi:hypothetical protein
MARTVFAVCTRDALWPPEVFVVFGTEDAARQHVDSARWAFRVEPLPVYANYAECPPENRNESVKLSGTGARAVRRLVDQGVIPARRSGFGAWPDTPVKLSPAWGPSTGVVYGVCGGDVELGLGDLAEVELYYETDDAAKEHGRRAAWMTTVLPFVVHASYAQCPLALRFSSSRSPYPQSQSMKLKAGNA